MHYWNRRGSRLPFDKIAIIIVMTLEGKSRREICDKTGVGMITAWNYKKAILEK